MSVKPPKRAVHCPQCHRFMFNVVMTAEAPRVGAFAEITDFKCARCGHTNLVLLGVSEKDNRAEQEKIEGQLRKQLEQASA